MAMTLASPSASPSPSVSGDSTRNSNTKNDSNNDDTNIKSEATSNNNNSNTTNNNSPANVKRKPSRRANTAERRATHNAVERQRRETLNGRFLDLAALLPNLSQIRRPSKSSIVNSSIAHIHASRRHRLLASRELRLLKAESDALRRELNEWRDRAGLPRVEEPVRSEAFAIVVSGEMDVLIAEMGAEMAAQGHGSLIGTGMGMMDVEEEDDMDDWGGAAPSAPSNPGYNGPSQYDDDVFVAAAPHHPQQQQQMAGHGGMGGMMMGPAHHLSSHPIHHQHAMHQGPPPQINGPYGYQQHAPQQQQQQQQQQQGGFIDDERHHPAYAMKGNPFAHNVPRGPGYDQNGAGALFTPPATRDGLPPNGVSNLTNSNNGGASPAHSSHSVRSAHSGHRNIGQSPSPSLGGNGATPPPLSAVSTGFGASNARSASGSPPLGPSYELSSGPATATPGNVNGHALERRSSFPPAGRQAGPQGRPTTSGPGGGVEMGMGAMMGFADMGGYGGMVGMHAPAHHGHAHGIVSSGGGGGLYGMML